MMRLASSDELIILDEVCGKQFELDRIASGSARASTVTRILNEIISDHPEYLSTVIAFATFPIQKWAIAARDSLTLNDQRQCEIADSMREIIEKKTALVEVYGISRDIRLPSYADCIETNRRIIDLVERSVRDIRSMPSIGSQLYNTLCKVHIESKIGDKDVSPFIIDKYYRAAITAIAQKYGQEFDRLVSFQKDILRKRDINSQLIFHNTEILLDIFCIIYWDCKECDADVLSDAGIASLGNRLDFMRLVGMSFEEVKQFPLRGELLYQYLVSRRDGLEINEFAESVSRSIRSAYYIKNEAINALSYVLWGYSTREILDGLSIA